MNNEKDKVRSEIMFLKNSNVNKGNLKLNRQIAKRLNSFDPNIHWKELIQTKKPPPPEEKQEQFL